MIAGNGKDAAMAATPRHEALPDDALEFFDTSDDAEEEQGEACEELALTPIPDSARPTLDDPAFAESRVTTVATHGSWFADEEPEPPYRADVDDSELESVDQLLVAQHYLFDDESDDQ